ncbi:MAG: phosphoribosyl-AMP cyclohydrolase [Roseiarcus sp.]|jgi:phosphoribosyl-AMP cyclohydrolase|uniref:phosphoribosyl-AMP cyclohydrolase n=1 Tax=Roseiarcus sp. TaxID=1969460 RepID=UPI003C20F9D9
MPGAAANDLEEGAAFTPRFSADGLVTCVAVEADSGEVLMLAHMNAEAIEKTLATGVMHYWSRSRQRLWRKGDTSGQVQTVVELRVDCDQDALLARVKVGGDGGACHTGRRSCFYRRVEAAADGARLAPVEGV